MHSRVFEISKEPVPNDDRYSAEWLPDWFYGSISDYASDVPDDQREKDIRWFVGFFAEQCKYDGHRIEFTDKALEQHFRKSYTRFLETAALLSAFSFEAFSGANGHQVLKQTLFGLNDAYEDKYGFYVYDPETEELATLDAWIRTADLTVPYYFGGIINYHW